MQAPSDNAFTPYSAASDTTSRLYASQEEIHFARDTLERYSGCSISEFQPNVLLTNFSIYVEQFAKKHCVQVYQGSMFLVAHCKQTNVSIIDFNMGSPAAALVVDLCSFLPMRSAIFLGMCGGLRNRYAVGEYFLPVAAIRGEGTSLNYFPTDVPALANFEMQRKISNHLHDIKTPYHSGICYTTNIRLWEYNPKFITTLKDTRAQCIEMECATLFIASYKYKMKLGSLLLISDLPLNKGGIKSKESASQVFKECTDKHIEDAMQVFYE